MTDPIPQVYLDEAVRRLNAVPFGWATARDEAVQVLARTLREFCWKPPVDPMLVRAREIVVQTLTPENHQRCNCREKITAGEWDDTHKVRIALIALREGMGE